MMDNTRNHWQCYGVRARLDKHLGLDDVLSQLRHLAEADSVAYRIEIVAPDGRRFLVPPSERIERASAICTRKSDATLCHARFVDADGFAFETGQSVTLPLHPARCEEEEPCSLQGSYLVLGGSGDVAAGSPQMVELEHPIVIFDLPSGGSKASRWDSRLAEYYGATGDKLAEALKADHYDAVVVVRREPRREVKTVILL